MSLFPPKEFNQPIVLERKATTANALNETVGTWAESMKAWARVRPVGQRDITAADHPWATGAYSFIIRTCGSHNTADMAAMRVKWLGGIYYVSGEPMRLDGARYLQIRAVSQKVNDV